MAEVHLRPRSPPLTRFWTFRLYPALHAWVSMSLAKMDQVEPDRYDHRVRQASRTALA